MSILPPGLEVPRDAAPETQPLVRRGREGRRLWVLGNLVTFKATSEETGGSYALWEEIAWPGAGPPPHIHHRETETFYVLEGRLRLLCGDRELEAGPGDFVQVPRGTLHNYKNVGETRARFLVQVVPGGFERCFEEFGRPVVDPSAPPAVEESDIRKLLAAAPRHSLEVPLPPE
jgi:mannose-6-phosphate isomerase-like protein (cupin superfamily)